jgi:hypothetical protein
MKIEDSGDLRCEAGTAQAPPESAKKPARSQAPPDESCGPKLLGGQPTVPPCPAPNFPMGELWVTRGAKDNLSDQEIWIAFARHSIGDWGEQSEDDRQANEAAVREGRYILSAYRSLSGLKFYVETPADRSATVVMLPEER